MDPTETSATEADLSPPWGLVVFNDDVSPMEGVQGLFKDVLDLDRSQAMKLMLRIHNKGYAVIAQGNEGAIDTLSARLDALCTERAPHLQYRKVAEPKAVADSDAPQRAEVKSGWRTALLGWLAILAIAAIVVWLNDP
ncbi:MAG: ATP-dependent Clp protease adaptor ClpS [Pseudomonadota bacterium]